MTHPAANIYRPLGPRVLIEVTAAKTVSAGGVILPMEEGRVLQEGTILSAGVGCNELKEGDYVMFLPYVGKTLTQINGRDQFIVVREDECHAKIDKPALDAFLAAGADAEAAAGARIAAERENLIKLA